MIEAGPSVPKASFSLFRSRDDMKSQVTRLSYFSFPNNYTSLSFLLRPLSFNFPFDERGREVVESIEKTLEEPRPLIE